LDFVPTPKWSTKVKDAEWVNLTSHIRRIEWSSLFPEEDTNPRTSNLPAKLKIKKNNRPNPANLDEEITTYCEPAMSKPRCLEPEVKNQYKNKNNLKPAFRTALRELKQAVCTNQIVICRSDKDGKIILLDYDTYNHIMLRELYSFSPLPDLCADNITKHFELIRNQVNDFVVQLHRSDFIDDKMLKHVVGMRCDQNKYSKIPGPIAKFFSCNEPAYAYPSI